MLTGKPSSYSTLTGKTSTKPIYIDRIKQVIFDRYITPILSKNWKRLHENMSFINIYISKINSYHDESLMIYSYILEVIKSAYETNTELSLLEQKLFGEDNHIAKSVIKIPQIRLKPELELYNLILGKPEKNLYNKDIVNKISSMLKIEYISFDDIKKIII